MNIQTLFRRPPGPRWSGFTLIEAVVATGVIGLIFVALYSGLAWGISTIRMSRENLRATQLLAEKMDALRLYTWSQVTDGKFIPKTFTASYSPASSTNSQGVVYSGAISIDTLDKGPDKDVFKTVNYKDSMRRVTIQLNWQSGNISRSRALSTYVTQNGLQSYAY